MIPDPTRGVFFDLFGTLVIYGEMDRAWEDWFEAFRAALAPHGYDVAGEEFARSCEGFFSRPEPGPDARGRTVFERRIHAFCTELGRAPTAGEVKEAAGSMIEAWGAHIRPDSEAQSVLTALGRDRKLALVSNYDHFPHAHQLLADLELGPLFDAVVVSSEVGLKKPDPRIFEIALRKTGLGADEVIHVGDAPEDVEGALAAGIQPILIRRERPPGSPVLRDYSRGRDSRMGDVEDPDVRIIRRLSELLGGPSPCTGQDQ